MLEIVIDFVVEIASEQTWLFQCDFFHYAEKLAKPKPAIAEQRLSISTVNSVTISSVEEHPYSSNISALCSRCEHYIFALWFLHSFFFFFRRLISAIAD